MPIYEYKCTNCDAVFEYLVLGGSAPDNCPECKGDQIKRLMSACGFLSKGSDGGTTASSAGASSCAGCSTTNCGSCG